MARWNELPMDQAAGHHNPGCDGRCNGKCQNDFLSLWHRAYARERQAPVASETPATARERISTPALGVETMEQVIGERLR